MGVMSDVKFSVMWMLPKVFYTRILVSVLFHGFDTCLRSSRHSIVQNTDVKSACMSIKFFFTLQGMDKCEAKHGFLQFSQKLQ